MATVSDELVSINSIYGDETLQLLNNAPGLYALQFPIPHSIVLRVKLPTH